MREKVIDSLSVSVSVSEGKRNETRSNPTCDCTVVHVIRESASTVDGVLPPSVRAVVCAEIFLYQREDTTAEY